jgi:hypothetical protein
MLNKRKEKREKERNMRERKTKEQEISTCDYNMKKYVKN